MNQQKFETKIPEERELTENELRAIQGGNIFEDAFRYVQPSAPVSKVPLSQRTLRRLIGIIAAL